MFNSVEYIINLKHVENNHEDELTINFHHELN